MIETLPGAESSTSPCHRLAVPFHEKEKMVGFFSLLLRTERMIPAKVIIWFGNVMGATFVTLLCRCRSKGLGADRIRIQIQPHRGPKFPLMECTEIAVYINHYLGDPNQHHQSSIGQLRSWSRLINDMQEHRGECNGSISGSPRPYDPMVLSKTRSAGPTEGFQLCCQIEMGGLFPSTA